MSEALETTIGITVEPQEGLRPAGQSVIMQIENEGGEPTTIELTGRVADIVAWIAANPEEFQDRPGQTRGSFQYAFDGDEVAVTTSRTYESAGWPRSDADGMDREHDIGEDGASAD